MAFGLFYNEIFPLRLVNFIKKYLDTGGIIMADNKTAGQLSKLQVLDTFFPSLLVRELPQDAEEAEYDYGTCCILALRKHGVLSNSGSYKQKINSIEDCLLGNSRNEETYKNYTAAQSMLRRSVSDLISGTDLFHRIAANLQDLYENIPDEVQRQELNRWMEQIDDQCRQEETVRICTAERSDGFSFSRKTYDLLMERIMGLLQKQDYCGCWTWMCLGSLFGNYAGLLMETYHQDFRPVADHQAETEEYRLISSPSVIPRPYFFGRDSYLKKIDEMFNSGNRVIFLHGIGGIGKTEIARQYAAQYENQYDVIIYAFYEGSLKNLIIADTPFETNPPVPRQTFQGVQESDASYFKRKLDLIRKSADQRTLIIIDNFNTESDEYLEEVLNGRYRVLVTTQYDYSRIYPSLRVTEIESMDDLVNVFMHHYQGYAVERDDPDLKKLILFIRCHTFTVILLAHHMENSGQSAAEMLDALSHEGISSLNEKTGGEGSDQDEAFRNLVRMFRVFDFDEEEQYVLQLLSICPLSGIPPAVFRQWADLSSFKTLISLEKRGWVIRNIGGIALHPVVQKTVIYQLPVHSEDIGDFLERASETIANENAWHFTRSEKERYSLIASEILSSLGALDPFTLHFCQSAAVLYGYSGHAEAAIELQKELYRYSCDHEGPYAFETARAAYRIGWTYLFNPHLDHAQKNAGIWLNKAKDLFDASEMNDIFRQSMYCGLLENLSKAASAGYDLTGRKEYLREAEKYAEQSVRLARQWLSDYRTVKRSPAGSLLRLADVCMAQKSYVKAEELIDEAYGILTEMYGENDPDVLRASSRKAKILYFLGKYSESLAQAEKNLNAYQEYYGSGNPSLFDQMVLKIQNCIQLGYKETALETRKEAERIQRKIFPGDTGKMRMLDELIS